MNQILEVERKPKKEQKVEIKKVVRFFAFILIAFAVFIISVVLGTWIKKAIKDKAPNVYITEEANKAVVQVEHDKAIDRILYSWNDQDQETIYGMGKSTLVEKIPLMEGNNTLNLVIYDAEGNESKYNKEFSIFGRDLEGPQIDMILEGSEVKIQISDNIELSSIVYKLQNGEEKQVPIGEDNKKSVECKIAIERGENTIYIKAIDNNGNVEEKEQTFIGSKKPKIQLFKDGNKLLVKLSDEDGLSAMECVVNEDTYTKEFENNAKEIEFTVPFKDGLNVITIKVTNVNGLQADADATLEY